MYTFKMKKESRRLIRNCPRTEPNTVKKPVTKTDFCNRFFRYIWLRSRTIPDQSLRFFFYFEGIHRRHPPKYSQNFNPYTTRANFSVLNRDITPKRSFTSRLLSRRMNQLVISTQTIELIRSIP
jgi:hypothetical protein